MNKIELFKKARLIYSIGSIVILPIILLIILNTQNIIIIIATVHGLSLLPAVSALYCAFWKCPECGNYFCRNKGFRNSFWPFKNKCKHCDYKI